MAQARCQAPLTSKAPLEETGLALMPAHTHRPHGEVGHMPLQECSQKSHTCCAQTFPLTDTAHRLLTGISQGRSQASPYSPAHVPLTGFSQVPLTEFSQTCPPLTGTAHRIAHRKLTKESQKILSTYPRARKAMQLIGCNFTLLERVPGIKADRNFQRR